MTGVVNEKEREMKEIAKDQLEQISGGGWVTVLKTVWKNGKKIVKKVRKYVKKNGKKGAALVSAASGGYEAGAEAVRKLRGTQP